MRTVSQSCDTLPIVLIQIECAVKVAARGLRYNWRSL